MCGLAGIFNLDGSPISTKYLASMTQLIKHRGPDDEGFLLINKEKTHLHPIAELTASMKSEIA